MTTKSAPKVVSIAARITLEQATRLDEVQAMEPPLRGRSAAVGRLLDLLTDDDLAASDAAEGKEGLPSLRPDDVAAVLAALDERTRAYSELSKQVRAVGHLLNTLTKLGHQIAKYGRAGMIPTAAIELAQRRLEPALERMATMAEQDAHVEAVVRACRPR
ncbi:MULTISPECIES: hypothetical protein [Arthrobacter]|uniref:Uncharacterized protein n=2 Tax=Arthrobacter TaxID=1663 RepID=A0ABU9KIX6_9MICC|nr:hypothetical protein [Arthrobacter sp. YJM1]MDP5226907.1 hypothetical protein [Arthrobacter sp. YJM1]